MEKKCNTHGDKYSFHIDLERIAPINIWKTMADKGTRGDYGFVDNDPTKDEIPYPNMAVFMGDNRGYGDPMRLSAADATQRIGSYFQAGYLDALLDKRSVVIAGQTRYRCFDDYGAIFVRAHADDDSDYKFDFTWQALDEIPDSFADVDEAYVNRTKSGTVEFQNLNIQKFSIWLIYGATDKDFSTEKYDDEFFRDAGRSIILAYFEAVYSDTEGWTLERKEPSASNLTGFPWGLHGGPRADTMEIWKYPKS